MVVFAGTTHIYHHLFQKRSCQAFMLVHLPPDGGRCRQADHRRLSQIYYVQFIMDQCLWHRQVGSQPWLCQQTLGNLLESVKTTICYSPLLLQLQITFFSNATMQNINVFQKVSTKLSVAQLHILESPGGPGKCFSYFIQSWYPIKPCKNLEAPPSKMGGTLSHKPPPFTLQSSVPLPPFSSAFSAPPC